MSDSQIYRELSLLHPSCRPVFVQLAKLLEDGYARGDSKWLFKPFETYRSVQRQLVVLAQGTSKSPAWGSAHQYGLAVDFVPFVPARFGSALGAWDWEIPIADWKYLHDMAGSLDLLAPIPWDKPHIQHRLFERVKADLFRTVTLQ